MRIVGFAEGAWGGIPGIVSVPTILRSTAARGHKVVLVIGGKAIFGSEKFVVPDLESALSRKEEEGTFGIVCKKAWTRRKICPALFWRFNKLVREADFVTLHSLYPFPVLAGYLLARLHRKPYGIWPHGVLAPFQRTVSARKKWVYNKLFADKILANASVIFFSAEGEREEAAHLGINAPSVIIPDGFNPDEFIKLPPRGRFRQRFLGGHKGPLILFLARLHAKKGLDLLIKAMQRVIAERPDARLAIVGPPDPPAFLKQIMEWIKESGIEAETILPGTAGPEMRLEAFADSDIYVLPSYAENFGFSVFEAMACGVPVVISKALNYGDEIAKAGAGMVLPRTPEDFASAMIYLIDRPELRHEIGERGRLFSRRYSQEETAAKVEGAIESIVKRRPFPANLAPVVARES